MPKKVDARPSAMPGEPSSWLDAVEGQLSRGLDRLEGAVSESAESARMIGAALERLRVLARFFSALERGLWELRAELDGVGVRSGEALEPGGGSEGATPSAGEAETAGPEEGPAEVETSAPQELTAAPGDQSATSTPFLLQLESSGKDIDLPAVDEAVRDLPGVIDISLLEYRGTRATLKVVAEGDEKEAEKLVAGLVRDISGRDELGHLTAAAVRGSDE